VTAVDGIAPTAAVASMSTTTRRRTPVSMVRHQLRYDLKVFWRNRQARFFTFALPVLMFVLFVSIFGQDKYRMAGQVVGGSTYYLANLIGFGTVDAAMMSMAIGIVATRESGILKRRRATPQPAWVVIVSRALSGIVASLALAAALLVLGRVAYSVDVPARSLAAFTLAVVIGTFAFCALGFAASGLIRNVDAAQPVMMMVSLPLFFISGVFVPWPFIPAWLHAVAAFFPVRHMALAVLTPLSSPRSGLRTLDLAITALWGVAGLLVAVRTFKWTPRAQQ
jgi:ABC-2 type transport system permease protein